MDLRTNVLIDEVFEEGDLGTALDALLFKLEEKGIKRSERLMWLFTTKEGVKGVGLTSMSLTARANPDQFREAIEASADLKLGCGPEDVIGGERVVVVEVTENAQGVEKNEVVRVGLPRKGGSFIRSGASPDGPAID